MRRGMSAPQQVPPWLQEQVERMQQAQQNLQAVHAQRQQLEIERIESERALEELKKAGDDQVVYKQAGSILIKSTKAELVGTLDEHKILVTTRSQVLAKQEERLRVSLKETEDKITSMMKGGPAAQAGGGGGGMAPPS